MILSFVKPLRTYGFLAFSISFLALALTNPANADNFTGRELPLQFDLRERIPKPDLTGVARIRFLTSVDFPPFNFIDQSGKLTGFHVDLAREICLELKVMERCQIEARPFADLRQALERGDGEVVAAGISVTTEMRQVYNFSRVFMQLPARFVLAYGKDGKLATIESLDGQEVGVVSATIHETMLKAFFPGIKAKGYTDRAAMLQALKTGMIPAVFGDGRALSFWVQSGNAGNCCDSAGGPYYSRELLGEGMTLMLKSDDRVLKEAIDHALLALTKNGRLEEIYLRYFPNGL